MTKPAQLDPDANAAAPDADAEPRALSDRTLLFYARDWAAFRTWCHRANLSPLPAELATLVAYVTDVSARHSPGAVARTLAAIADQHRRHGMIAPVTDPALKAVLRAARRTATPRRDPPPSPEQLARMIAACPGDLAGLRDRAMLSVMAATGLGRATLLSLDAEQIRISSSCCNLHMGEDDERHVFRLVRDPDLRRCPVQALEHWLRVSETSFGAVFRKVDRWGTIDHHRLGHDAIRRIFLRRMPSRLRPSAGPGIAAAPAAPVAPA